MAAVTGRPIFLISVSNLARNASVFQQEAWLPPVARVARIHVLSAPTPSDV